MNTPSPDLLKAVRAELILKGSSLKAFCEANGFVRQHVGQVISGKRTGPKAAALADSFLKALRADK